MGTSGVGSCPAPMECQSTSLVPSLKTTTFRKSKLSTRRSTNARLRESSSGDRDARERERREEPLRRTDWQAAFPIPARWLRQSALGVELLIKDIRGVSPNSATLMVCPPRNLWIFGFLTLMLLHSPDFRAYDARLVAFRSNVVISKSYFGGKEVSGTYGFLSRTKNRGLFLLITIRNRSACHLTS